MREIIYNLRMDRCLVLAFVSVLMLSLASSTSVTFTDVPTGSDQNILAPGDNLIEVASFRVNDGGDENISGNIDPGDSLYNFEENTTMFLNQTEGLDSAVGGFDQGEDILRVSSIHNAGLDVDFSGEVVENFSRNTTYSDGGNRSDGLFNGDKGENYNSEAIIFDNTTGGKNTLEREDYVLSEGSMNLSNFSDSVRALKLTPGDTTLVRNDSGAPNILNNGDTVIKNGSADLQRFADTIRFADTGSGDSIFEGGNAILNESGDRDNALERDDEVLKNGSVDFKNASLLSLSYFNNTAANFQNVDEPIYHERTVQDHLINVSDVRVGDITISVSGNLFVMSNDTMYNSSLEMGKPIYNVTDANTGYGGDGSFKVLEFDNTGAADGTWNPRDDTDQEVLIYDLQSDTPISAGETLIYDSHPSRTTIPNTIEAGEEFNATQANNVESSGQGDNNYVPEVNITFDGSDSTYDSFEDNVTLNVTYNSNSEVVILGPKENASTLGYEGSLHDGGYVRFWNASRSDDGEEPDGLYVDMDKDGYVTEGDVRLGSWTRVNPAGDVSKGDVDVGINLSGFSQSDHVKILDADHDNRYDSGDGTESNTGGREAIVVSEDNILDTEDEIVRSGSMDLIGFRGKNPERRYVDDDGRDVFDGYEAIVKNEGNDPQILEDDDVVIQKGTANLNSVPNEYKYVESGESSGFEKGSQEAIVRDGSNDGVFQQGSLDSGSDVVVSPGEANLQTFQDPPSTEGDTGRMFVDYNETGRYNVGERILNTTLLTNGTVSNQISGMELFNFASSTKHNSSGGYSDGDAIINDTDMNNVYKDVLENLEISNRLDTVGKKPEFLKNVTSSEVEGDDLVLYRDKNEDSKKDESDDDYKISEMSYNPPGASQPHSWSVSGLSINIDSDKEFVVVFNSSSPLDDDSAFGFKSNLTQIGTEGDQELKHYLNSGEQIIDSHAPEIVDAWTGNTSSGNSHSASRDRVYVETNELYKGLNIDTVDPTDFSVYAENSRPLPGIKPAQIIERNANNFEIRLNDTISTDRKLALQLDDAFTDYGAANIRDSDNSPNDYDVKDGLRPRLIDVKYQDLDNNGRIDELDVVLSENISYPTFDSSDWGVLEKGISGLTVDGLDSVRENIIDLKATADGNNTGVEELSKEPLVNYTDLGTPIEDESGNELDKFTKYRISDDSGPVIFNGTTRDRDNDSRPDKLILNFTESLDDNSSVLLNSSFDITDPTTGEIKSVDTAEESNDSVLRVNISSLGDTSVTPVLEMLNGSIFDQHGKSINTSQKFSAFSEDSNPILIGAALSSVNSTSDNSFVKLEFSEQVEDSTDRAAIEIGEKKFNFSTDQANSTRLVDYGKVLDTSVMHNITNISGVVDSSGNAAARHNNENVTVNTFRREMNEGWNFVSFPIADASEPEFNQLMNVSKINVVWTYYDGDWKTYDPDAPVNEFDSADGGRGYLINASEDFTLEVNVNHTRNNTKSTDLEEMAVEVGSGFNLIGQFQEFRQKPRHDEAFASMDNKTGLVIGSKYRNGSNILDLENPIRDDLGDVYGKMEPGHAYWMSWEGDGVAEYREPVIGG